MKWICFAHSERYELQRAEDGVLLVLCLRTRRQIEVLKPRTSECSLSCQRNPCRCHDEMEAELGGAITERDW